MKKDCRYFKEEGGKEKCEILVRLTCRKKGSCAFYKPKSVEDLFDKRQHAAYTRIVSGGKEAQE